MCFANRSRCACAWPARTPSLCCRAPGRPVGWSVGWPVSKVARQLGSKAEEARRQSGQAARSQRAREVGSQQASWRAVRLKSLPGLISQTASQPASQPASQRASCLTCCLHRYSIIMLNTDLHNKGVHRLVDTADWLADCLGGRLAMAPPCVLCGQLKSRV